MNASLFGATRTLATAAPAAATATVPEAAFAAFAASSAFFATAAASPSRGLLLECRDLALVVRVVRIGGEQKVELGVVLLAPPRCGFRTRGRSRDELRRLVHDRANVGRGDHATACVCVSSSTRAPPSTFTERASRPASHHRRGHVHGRAHLALDGGKPSRASVRRDPTEQSPVDQLARRDSEQAERARHASAPDPAARIGVGSLKAGEDGNWPCGGPSIVIVENRSAGFVVFDFFGPNTTTTSAMGDLVPETQEDPRNRVLLAGWGTSMSVPQDSPPASIPAGKPVSARAARAAYPRGAVAVAGILATRESRGWRRTRGTRVTRVGVDPRRGSGCFRGRGRRRRAWGLGRRGPATGRRLSRLNSHFKECGFASGTAVAAMFRFQRSPVARDDTRAVVLRTSPTAPRDGTRGHLAFERSRGDERRRSFTHSCARLNDGTIACWGSNDAGELGNTSVALGGESDPRARGRHRDRHPGERGLGPFVCCPTGGTVECWGSNSEGQLGSTSITQSATPVLVEGITTATSVSLGGAYSCALLTDGTIKCWGRNTENQLGNGGGQQSETPVSVQDITTATQLGAGMQHSCAVLTDGTVWCWGVNSLGELQPNTLIANSAKPREDSKHSDGEAAPPEDSTTLALSW